MTHMAIVHGGQTLDVVLIVNELMKREDQEAKGLSSRWIL